MYKKIIENCKYFFSNRIYVFFLLFSMVLGYGYLLTHGTCGIDDISIDLYFEKGMGVAIGRWPYYLVNKIIPIAKYTPFYGDLVTILVLVLSATLWCALLQIIFGDELHILCYCIYSSLFLLYPMNADIFVFYLQNGLGWLHLFSILALISFYYIFKEKLDFIKQLWSRIVIIITLTIAISFYESAANIFLTGGLLIVLLDLYIKKDCSVFRGKNYFKMLFFLARYLVYAMIARRMVRAIIMRLFGITAYTFYRSPMSVTWLLKGGVGQIWTNIKMLLFAIYRDYFAMAVIYWPALLFVLASVIFFLCLLKKSVKVQDIVLFLTGVLVYFSVFAICAIEGTTMKYRACQIFSVFVALIAALFFAEIKKHNRLTQFVGMFVYFIVIIISAVDMTRWFMLDYQKTEYEMHVIDQIGGELFSGKYNVEEKPVIFVGDYQLPQDIYEKYCIDENSFGWSIVKSAVENAGMKVENSYAFAQNNSSIIDWSVRAFAMYSGYNVPIRQLFSYRGYMLKEPEQEMIKEAFSNYYSLDWEYYSYSLEEAYTELYDERDAYPNEGYIIELDEYIVILL